MDIIAKARELGELIQKDERYLKLQIARQNNDKDEELQKQMDQLEIIRGSYQSEMEKQEPDQEKIKKLNGEFSEIYGKVMQKPVMMDYTRAKNEVNKMMNDINSILVMCVNGEDPETCAPAQASCGTDGCSGCSGCN